jgi:RHS repeat-associated protein
MECGFPGATRSISDGVAASNVLLSTQANWSAADVGATLTAAGQPAATILSINAFPRNTVTISASWSGAIPRVDITQITHDDYVLDPFGRPICERRNGATREARSWFYGPDGKLLFSLDPSPTTAQIYLRLKGQLYSTKTVDVSQSVPVDLGNTNLVNDPMGTAVAQVAPDGTITSQESTPFGELIWNTTTPAVYQNQQRGRSRSFFTLGEPFDLFDTPARMYSPFLGRYLAPDPKLGAVGLVLGHDRYTHALNDPNTYADPDGRVPFFVVVAYGCSINPACVEAVIGVTLLTVEAARVAYAWIKDGDVPTAATVVSLGYSALAGYQAATLIRRSPGKPEVRLERPPPEPPDEGHTYEVVIRKGSTAPGGRVLTKDEVYKIGESGRPFPERAKETERPLQRYYGDKIDVYSRKTADVPGGKGARTKVETKQIRDFTKEHGRRPDGNVTDH